MRRKATLLTTFAAALISGGGMAMAQSMPRMGAQPVPLEPVTGDLSQAAAPDGSRSLTGVPVRSDAQMLRDPRGYYHCDEDAVHGQREICLDLTIGYTTTQIYNPFAKVEHGRDVDTVRLRSYIPTSTWLTQNPDAGDVPTARFLAPEIHMVPGQTVRLTLRNQLPLPADAEIPGPQGNKCADIAPATDSNTPHCVNFNRTNLHTHGLWISPAGNSDNVHISIDAGESFQYEYNVPADHPAGTFWYHSHLHGSTAAQVASGMAGAIIVKGDRNPVPDGDGGWARAGDVDVLLSNIAQDRTILMQQLSYGCRNADGALSDVGGVWRDCGTETGMLEPGATAPFDQFAPGSWGQSRRFTSINGAVWPILGLAAETGESEQDPSFFAPAVAGTVERWRLIHGGVRDTLQIQFRKATLPADIDIANSGQVLEALQSRELAAMRMQPEDDSLSRDSVVAEICADPASGGTPPLTVFGLASDGLTHERIVARTDTIMQPGYREDLLVNFPEPGIYCVIDSRAPDRTRINPVDPDVTPVPPRHGRDLLGYVIVKPAPEGTPTVQTADLAQLATWLKAEAAAVFGPRIPDSQNAAALIDAIRMGLDNTDPEDGTPAPLLTPFVHHPDITDDEVIDADGDLHQRSIAFSLGGVQTASGAPTTGVVPLTSPFRFMVGRIGQTGTFDAAPNNGRFVFWAGAPYDHNRIDQVLTLDRAEEIWLTSFAAGPHPYHIHVNPFQVVSAQLYRPPGGCNQRSVEGGTVQVPDDPRPGCQINEGNSATWLDVLRPGAVLANGPLPAATESDPDAQRELDLLAVAPSQYAGSEKVWRDTLAIENFVLIKARSRYQRYIGDFVLHCHILDHEDQGMMQNVRVVLPVGVASAPAASSPLPAGHGGH